MTDRELLEAAAKAIGMAWDSDAEVWYDDFRGLEYWDPLTDDGDALRLAVKLCLVINNRHVEVLVEDRMGLEFWEPHGGDEPAATRRAIVRAAAAIGAALK